MVSFDLMMQDLPAPEKPRPAWPFDEQPDPFAFDFILADPPWPFENYSAKGESRNPKRHYPTMSIAQIKRIPVGDYAARDCGCGLWVVDSLLDAGIDVLRAWGFRYTTVLFTWAKRTPNDTGWHMNTGYYTRGNPEMCLLGVTGRVGLPAARDVRQLIVEPVREHSRKPDRIHSDIERLYPGRRYLELFARRSEPRAGWTFCGSEKTMFNERDQ